MITITTVVDVDPSTAFRIFTEDIDAWWRRTPRHLTDSTRSAKVRFDSGSLVEIYDDATIAIGVVTTWEPGRRVVLSWLGSQPGPAEETEVEIRFEPLEGRTRVILEHRGWTGLQLGDAKSSVIGLWWSELLVTFRAKAQQE